MIFNGGLEFSQHEVVKNDVKIMLVIIENDATDRDVDDLNEAYATGHFQSLAMGSDSIIVGRHEDFPQFWADRKRFMG